MSIFQSQQNYTAGANKLQLGPTLSKFRAKHSPVPSASTIVSIRHDLKYHDLKYTVPIGFLRLRPAFVRVIFHCALYNSCPNAEDGNNSSPARAFDLGFCRCLLASRPVQAKLPSSGQEIVDNRGAFDASAF